MGGLIPIITKSSGLNIDNFGIIIKKLEKESTEIAINEALRLDINKLFDMAKSAKNNIRVNYTFDNYKENLKKLVIDIIK